MADEVRVPVSGNTRGPRPRAITRTSSPFRLTCALIVPLLVVRPTMGAGTQPYSSIEAGVGRGNEYVSTDLPKAVLIPVRVIGAVNKPGIHYIPRATDLVTLLALCGGPGAGADGTVVIKRYTASKHQLYKMDIKDLVEEKEVPTLAADDIIYVHPKTPAIDDNTVRIVSFASSLLALAISAFVLVERVKR